MNAPRRAAVGVAILAALWAFLATPSAPPRVEARSANLLAVGIVQRGRMYIHVSRLDDNSPVRDAEVTVLLRGVLHSTIAEADGSYALTTPDLDLPGSSAVQFRVRVGTSREVLDAVMMIAGGTAVPEEKSSTRQLWWWVLNFGVCIGFLMLISRRRKAAKPSAID